MSAIIDPEDAQRVRAILATVEAAHGADEAAWLAMRIGAQPALRAARIERRDALVRQALRQFGEAPATRAAKLLAEMIEQRLRVSTEALARQGSLEAMVDEIITLNSWRSLAWRQLHAIGAG